MYSIHIPHVPYTCTPARWSKECGCKMKSDLSEKHPTVARCIFSQLRDASLLSFSKHPTDHLTFQVVVSLYKILHIYGHMVYMTVIWRSYVRVHMTGHSVHMAQFVNTIAGGWWGKQTPVRSVLGVVLRLSAGLTWPVGSPLPKMCESARFTGCSITLLLLFLRIVPYESDVSIFRIETMVMSVHVYGCQRAYSHFSW